MRVHLVDGTYELFRAYYGALRDSPGGRGATAQQEPFAAVQGLLQSLLSLLRRDAVSHIAVAFDHVIESYRNDLFPGYKSSDGVPADLLAQFPLAEEAVDALGIVVWPMVEFEADDALATAATRWAQDPAVERVIICSPDKDLAQVVAGSRVITRNRMREEDLDESGVAAKFGVAPAAIPDYLALVGDSADGIPGVPRWGAKSAATLLAHYGSLDQIPADPAAWEVNVRGKEALAQNLVAAAEEARLYRTLATLRRDVPIAETLADIEWQGVPRASFLALCSRLGAPELVTRPHRWHELPGAEEL
jgi:5'-3' exonuclease